VILPWTQKCSSNHTQQNYAIQATAIKYYCTAKMPILCKVLILQFTARNKNEWSVCKLTRLESTSAPRSFGHFVTTFWWHRLCTTHVHTAQHRQNLTTNFCQFKNNNTPMEHYIVKNFSSDIIIYNNNNNNKRRNIRASPTRISFNLSQWNPTVRSVPVLCPSWPLWANDWRAPPATCARRHFYSKDSRSLFNVLIPS